MVSNKFFAMINTNKIFYNIINVISIFIAKD